MLRFQAKLFETRALWFYARTRNVPVRANVRLRHVDLSYSRRPEVDGLVLSGRSERVIEVKSYPLDGAQTRAALDRYRTLGFTNITLMAPAFETREVGAGPGVELIEFEPALDAVRSFYAGAWQHRDPAVAAWLKPGGIHFRFSVAEVSKGAATRALNQVDKGIRGYDALERELHARVLPSFTPVRIHWSPVRLLFPKDLFHRERRVYVLDTPVVFDVDGELIHRAMFPCTIDPTSGVCQDCVAFAKQDTLKLAKYLRAHGFEPHIFFSGRGGFHVYVFERGLGGARRQTLLRGANAEHVGVDRQIARHPTPILNFPTSLNGTSIRPLVRTEHLERFRLEDAPVGGTP